MKLNENNSNGDQPTAETNSGNPSIPKDLRATLQANGLESVKKILAGAEVYTTSKKTDEDKARNIAKKKGEKAEPPDEEEFLKNCAYDGKIFLLWNGKKDFVPLDRKSIECHLVELGFEDVGKVINRVQRDHYVRVIEGYAGRPRGFHSENGNNYLIVEGPRIMEPKQGSWDTLRAVIAAIIGNDPVVGDLQVTIFLLWLKVGYEALVAGVRMPGQALVLAGPAGCGKSLLIDLIVKVLGGRRGQPHKYITNRTSFNGELLGAEVLVSDDDSGSTDIRTRRGVAAQYKNLLFAGEVSIEAKYGTPRSCSPFWRLVIAANSEPESLLVLPPMSADIVDKITLISCLKRELPMPSNTPEQRDLFFATLVREIPALLYDLLHMEIPEELKDGRCGVNFFHHPTLLESLMQLAPEHAMLELIDEALPLSKMTLGFLRPWEGTAAELRRELFEFSAHKRDVETVLPTPQTAGTYLARLAGEGKRVERLKLLDGRQRWRINPLFSVKERLAASHARRMAKLDATIVMEYEIENSEYQFASDYSQAEWESHPDLISDAEVERAWATNVTW